jgi:hypothetical protein
MIIANQKQQFFRTFQEKIEKPTFTAPRRLECSAQYTAIKKPFIQCVVLQRRTIKQILKKRQQNGSGFSTLLPQCRHRINKIRRETRVI